MDKIIEWLKGKKTYFVAGLTGVGAVIVLLGYPIPAWVWMLLGALGLGAVRASVDKIKK